MHLPLFALMNRQHGLVTHRQALDAGLSDLDVRRLVRSGAWARIRRGVYADQEMWEDLDPFRGRPLLRIRAARLTLQGGSYVFSHDSASIVLDMGAPDPRQSLVHVTHPHTHGDAIRAGVKHHRAPYSPKDVVVVDDIPVLGPVRTALDMAREHGRVSGLAACDQALRRGASRADLAAALERMRCWPHSRVMRWCVEMADPGAESWLESQGREFVLELGIGRPETQFGLSDGHRTVWCDLRVGRHLFEPDGLLKYGPDNPAGIAPEQVLRKEKQRQDFVTGFKLGMSRLTAHDMGAGRRAAMQRCLREYDDTCRRFGTSIADLAPYVVRRNPFPHAG